MMLISSAYFRSMPEHSSELSGQSEKVVHLDIDSERFAKLLRFLNDGPEARAGLDWPSLEAIVETSDRYEFDIVPELVARGAVSVLRDNRHTFSEPLSIFRFAAENDSLYRFVMPLSSRTRHTSARSIVSGSTASQADM
jgi:hypothetical protein